MNAHLTRFMPTCDGLFGVLSVGDFRCFTVERPWYNNAPNISCIPEGEYRLVLGRYNAGGYPAYEFVDVPGRSLIKIHAANLASQIQGCIAPGQWLGRVEGKRAVVRSKPALAEFMEAMGGARSATITVDNLTQGETT